MIEILEAAKEVEQFFRRRRWKFCIIGGVAVMRWIPPRTTEDVDFSLMTSLGNEARVIDRILQDFEGRGSDAREFAFESRVLLIRSSNGTDIDIALAAFAFEETILERATRFRFARGVTLTTASAEDLLLMKAVASRARDWLDIGEIMTAQKDKLDWAYLDRQAVLLEQVFEMEILNRIQAERDRLS